MTNHKCLSLRYLCSRWAIFGDACSTLKECCVAAFCVGHESLTVYAFFLSCHTLYVVDVVIMIKWLQVIKSSVACILSSCVSKTFYQAKSANCTIRKVLFIAYCVCAVTKHNTLVWAWGWRIFFSFFSPFLFHVTCICDKVLFLKLVHSFRLGNPKAAAHVAV